MPKHEPLTPKAIGKRIKSKGLQKLKWYCQMCQKQCRDQNGFKCHSMSESHQRQLLLFAENPHKYMDAFSQEFLKDFTHLVKRRFGTKRVPANQVYQEYIKDKGHLHMNSTRWVTLTGLVKWMGRKGICHVDHTEKGWFITYIDRDPETMLKQSKRDSKHKLDKDYEQRLNDIIDKQIERGKQLENGNNSNNTTITTPSASTTQSVEFIKQNDEQKITFAINSTKLINTQNTLPNALSTADSTTTTTTSTITTIANPLKTDSSKFSDTLSIASSKRKNNLKPKKSAIDEIIEEQEKIKAKKLKCDNWLLPGIVVKVITDSLGDKYYNKKGVINSVGDGGHIAIVSMIDSNDVLKLDEKHIETVIPQINRPVLVLRGLYRGCNATLLRVNYDRFDADIRLETGSFKAQIINNVKYENISKLY